LLLLVVVTVIWGTTFPLVKTMGERLPSAAIVTVRFLVAGLVLLPWLFSANKLRLKHGMILGLVSFASYATQTIGLHTVSSGRGAFLTAINVILVPLAFPLLGRVLPRVVLLAAVIAVLGIGMLSWDDGALTFSVGDVWILLCAISYALYVLLLERFAPQHPVLGLSAVQVATVSACGVVWLVVSDPQKTVSALQHASLGTWATLVYLGAIAVAVTTLLQTNAQRIVSAAIAAVVYALEPVFGAFFSWLWRGETLKPIGFVGGALVIVAMVVSQLPSADPDPTVLPATP
jgi:drug/metabolite transporter (DMT)-like permease